MLKMNDTDVLLCSSRLRGSDATHFRLQVIEDPTESDESLNEREEEEPTRYLIASSDSASFTFARGSFLLFDLLITIRETSPVARWHSEFHRSLGIVTPGVHSPFLTGGRQLLARAVGGGGIPQEPERQARVPLACWSDSPPPRLISSQSVSHLPQALVSHEHFLTKVRRPPLTVRGNVHLRAGLQLNPPPGGRCVQHVHPALLHGILSVWSE